MGCMGIPLIVLWVLGGLYCLPKRNLLAFLVAGFIGAIVGGTALALCIYLVPTPALMDKWQLGATALMVGWLLGGLVGWWLGLALLEAVLPTGPRRLGARVGAMVGMILSLLWLLRQTLLGKPTAELVAFPWIAAALVAAGAIAGAQLGQLVSLPPEDREDRGGGGLD